MYDIKINDRHGVFSFHQEPTIEAAHRWLLRYRAGEIKLAAKRGDIPEGRISPNPATFTIG